MHILILGGTGFIGSAMARALVAAGHQVSVLARGQTQISLPDQVEILTGDRTQSDGLRGLAGRIWDVCVDVSGYLPQQVTAIARLLPEVQRYIFISAVAGYGDPVGPVTETFPTPRLSKVEQEQVVSMDDLDNRTYGPSKIACEDTLCEEYGEKLTVLRPQVVTGPYDPTGRFTVWPARAAAHARVIIPGTGNDYLQVVDVRDIAAFVVKILENDIGGTFNLAGERILWAEFVRLLGIREPVWIPVTHLEAQDIPLSCFPLFRPVGGIRSGLMDVSNEKAQQAGFQVTPFLQTLTDVQRALTSDEIQKLGQLSKQEQQLLEWAN